MFLPALQLMVSTTMLKVCTSVMIDFHIGTLGLLPNFVYELALEMSSNEGFHLTVVSRGDYQSLVQPYIVNRKDDDNLRRKLNSAATSLLGLSASHAELFISDPFFMGDSRALIRSGKALPLSDARVKRASELFGSREVTFHVNIASMVDVIWRAPGLSASEKLMGLTQTELSWANVIWRLTRSAPERRFLVWNCEKQALIQQAIAEYFSLATRVGQPIKLQSAETAGSPFTSQLLEDPGGEFSKCIERLDDQFEIDLAKLNDMKNVTLISP